MAKDGHGLQCRVIATGQASGASQHDGAHRSRQQVVSRSGCTQELIEKQWMTVSTLDASSDGVWRQLRKMGRKFLSFVFGERREIDGGDRTAAGACAPARIDRIAL